MPSRRRPKQLLFDRGGRDFSARDRAVLDLLTLVRLYRESEARRSLREALALHESSRAAVVLLDANDRVTFASTAACELFVRCFGERGARLPDSLAPWLRERRRTTAGAPLRIDARGRSLVIELVDGALLLEEWQRLPRLTRREREVLELVADGRTNAQIAGRLWVSPGTVRKPSRQRLHAARRAQPYRRRGGLRQWTAPPVSRPLRQRRH